MTPKSVSDQRELRCYSYNPIVTANSFRSAMQLCRRVLSHSHRWFSSEPFVFTSANYCDPELPHGLTVVEVPLVEATDEALSGLGRLVHAADDYTVERGNFEISRWPQQGWRPLDPDTGDEAGTTEGDFTCSWQGDYYNTKNLAVATSNNMYLDGLGALPEEATRDSDGNGDGQSIFLWMSDYHPDGAQLFWPRQPTAFVMCLGPATSGDDIQPEDMRAFYVRPGTGVYIHPGTWHNGVYIAKQHSPATFLTRQGRVHARVSASWASEFGCILRVPLTLPQT